MTVEVKCFHKLGTMKTKPAVSFCPGCHEENEHVKQCFCARDLASFIFTCVVFSRAPLTRDRRPCLDVINLYVQMFAFSFIVFITIQMF